MELCQSKQMIILLLKHLSINVERAGVYPTYRLNYVPANYNIWITAVYRDCNETLNTATVGACVDQSISRVLSYNQQSAGVH